jgi:hypothetical protein
MPGAMIRPNRSAPPPAANGTTMVRGRVGHSCARAGVPDCKPAAISTADSASNRLMAA